MKKNSTLLKLNKFTKNSFLSYATVIIFYTVISILMSNGGISSSFKGQLIPICAYAVMAVSLNLTVGILGDLSLGHAGFMSVGAFAGVIASQSMRFNGVESDALRMLVAIVVGIVVAAVFGIIIGVPVLRLKGDYLAIVTLAFGEIIRDILNCFYIGIDKKGLHFSVQNADSLGLAADGKVLVNGPIGATGIDKISTFTAGTILVIFTLFIVYNLTNSRAGRAIMSIRDNRIAAESVGINITKYKMMAFVTSAALAGGAGALYALNYSTVVSSKFDFNTSILVLVFVVLGGMGNIFGSLISATMLTVLPQVLREFRDYRMLVYALVLILVMLVTNSDKIQSYKEMLFVKLFKKKKKSKHNSDTTAKEAAK